MSDDGNIAFHAARLLENPAWRRGLEETRKTLSQERDALELDDPRRHHLSIAETLLTKLERRFMRISRTGMVEQFNKQQASKIA